jgi:ketosteroid isomerase-like protein
VTNSEIVKRFLKALVQDEPDTMRPLVHDDILWWVPPSAATRFRLARPLQGWDDIDWLGGGGWKGFKPGTSAVVIHHLIAENDLVSAHYNRSAKRIDGTDYDVEYNLLFRLAEGRIAEVWEIADTANAFGAARRRIVLPRERKSS